MSWHVVEMRCLIYAQVVRGLASRSCIGHEVYFCVCVSVDVTRTQCGGPVCDLKRLAKPVSVERGKQAEC